MHPVLLQSLERIEQAMRADERCLALALAGSMGTGTADDHSDVDVAAVVRGADFAAFCAGLRPVLDRLCGPIVVWLPEGACDDSCNFAFLFRSGDELLLYDFYVVKEKVAAQLAVPEVKVLFDRCGCLGPPKQPGPPPPAPAATVAWAADNWWVYCYLNGKYLRRGDTYKLVYVQDALFLTHLKLLNAVVQPDRVWNWWARDVKHLPPGDQERLLAYFGAVQPDEVRGALRVEMDAFSADARRACEQCGVPYPSGLEAAVRAHLARVGV